jgi:small subunit ribosomal protein S2
MPFVNNRWLGGLLTNWRTISERIAYLHDLRRLKRDGQLELLPPKERIAMEADLEKLEANLGGVADLKRPPDAVFVVDMKKEQLAIREARRLGVPVVGLVDTNADPDDADFVVPGNDDAIRSCTLVARVLADGIEAGRLKVSPGELAASAPEGEGDVADEAPPAEAAAEPTAASEEASTDEPAPEAAPEAAAVTAPSGPSEGGESQ